MARITIAAIIGNNGILKKTIEAKHATKLAEYEERINIIVGEEQINKIIWQKEEKLKDLVKENLRGENWVEEVKDIEQDNTLGEDQLKIYTKDNYILLVEISDDGKIIIIESGLNDGEPFPTIILEQLPFEGTENEKIKIKVTASVEITDKTKEVTQIKLINTAETKAYDKENGVIFEVDGNGEYIFEATTNHGKTKRGKIVININEPTEEIEIYATPTTARNTIITGTQNGVEAGAIKVTIDYKETGLQNQYKKTTDIEWTTVEENKTEIEVTENIGIIARYYDGTNVFKVTTYNIQNVDNIAPTFSTYNVTVSGKTITAIGEAIDTASEGASGEIAGIKGYEYRINEGKWQTNNTFTITTAGKYTIDIKAIDKAGNETIATKEVTATNYTVSYDANGGTGAPSAQTEISGVNLTLSSTAPTRTGYTFKGWATSNTATTAEYEKGGTYTANKTVTLYAVWSANTNTAYKVVHQQMNVNGSGYTTKETQNLTGTTGASVTPAVKSYTGFTSPSQQKVTIAADGSTTVTYKYTRNKYTFTLGSGTGVSTSGSSASGSYYYGATITLKATANTGYTFSKWTSSNTSLVANKTTASTTFTMPAGAITMTPSATVITYTITYNLNGGSVQTANPTSYNVTSNAITLNNPTKTGYTFTGWTGSNGTTAQTTVTIAKGSTGNKTYTANWTPLTYTIKYDANGGSGAPSNQTKTYGVNLTLSSTVPTRDGYAFLGWSTSKTATSATYTAGGTYTANSAATLYAVWESTELKYTISTSGKASASCTGSTFTINTGSLSNGESSYACITIYNVPSGVTITGASNGSGNGPNGTVSFIPGVNVYLDDTLIGTISNDLTSVTTTESGTIKLIFDFTLSGNVSVGGQVSITSISKGTTTYTFSEQV